MTEVGSICVILPAYGATPHLAEILHSLICGSLKPNRIIVSHSGAGNPATELSKSFPEVEFLHSETRLFAGQARNRAAALVSDGILAFCDCDVLPAFDWLQHLVDALKVDAQRFVVGSVGMARKGGYWGTSNWLCEFSEQTPWRPEGEQTGGASCNMAVRKAHFAFSGGFPADMQFAEDTTLFHLLRKQGLRQWFVPSATVGHFNHSGFTKFARHQWTHGEHFARARQEAKLPGWRIIRSGWMAPLLPFAKMGRVIRRMFEGDARQCSQAVFYFPGILIGTTIWGAGLARELVKGARDTS